ncbi:MAG: response regulator [Flavobacteriales bacterium]|nr:response regulator [Flavobacteriales bacterium]
MKNIRNIVLIDDSEVDNLIHKTLLERNHFAEDIKSFESSTEALSSIQESAKKAKVPDLILLDIAMPVMDSYEFLDEFEKIDSQLVSACKVIIVTSSVNPKDKEKSLKRDSVDGFLIKPLTEKVLLTILN